MELRSKHVVAQLALLSVAVAMVVGGGGDICGRSLIGDGSAEAYASRRSLAEILESFSEAVKEADAGTLIVPCARLHGCGFDLIDSLGGVDRHELGSWLGVDDHFVDYCVVWGRVINLPPPLA